MEFSCKIGLVLLLILAPAVAEEENPWADLTTPLYERDTDAALKALDRIFRKDLGHPAVHAALEHAVLKARDWRVKSMALRCTAFQDTTATPEPILKLSRDKRWQLRLGLAEALIAYRHLDSVDALIGLLEDERLRIRSTAAASLFLLTLRDHGLSVERWKKWRREEGKDFVLPSRKDRPRKDGRRDPHAYGRPGWFEMKITSDRVVFLLDRSESMHSGLYDAVVDEFVKFAKASGDGLRFAIVPFDDKPDPWRKKLTPARGGAITSARSFLSAKKPQGMTNVMDSLEIAFDMEEPDTFILLSDGLPTRGAIIETGAICDEVRRVNKYRRIAIHTVLLVRGRSFPHDGPKGDAKPPLDARDRAKQKKLRSQHHLTKECGFLRELALRNEGEFDFAFADWYRAPPGAVLKPGTDRPGGGKRK